MTQKTIEIMISNMVIGDGKVIGDYVIEYHNRYSYRIYTRQGGDLITEVRITGDSAILKAQGMVVGWLLARLSEAAA